MTGKQAGALIKWVALLAARLLWRFGFALIALLLGLYLGVTMSQPAKVIEPTKSLYETTERLDRSLGVAASHPRQLASEIAALRSQIKAPVQPGLAAERARQSQMLRGLDDLEAKLDAQNADYRKSLLEAEDSVARERESLERLAGEGGTLATVYDQARRFMVWTGPVIFLGLLTVLMLLVLLTIPTFRRFIGRSGSISMAGVTFTLQDINSLRLSIRQRLTGLDQEISNIYMEKLVVSDVNPRFAEFKAELNEVFLQQLGIDLSKLPHRSNLFVPGFAGDELIQATNYLGAGMIWSRFGAGRRFSTRYGIVGMGWRLRRPLYNENVNNNDDNLIRHWGLTKAEAAEQDQDSKSLMAFPIPGDAQDADPLGIVYLEAEGMDVLRPQTLPAGFSLPSGSGSNEERFAQAVWTALARKKALKQLKKELKALRADLDWDRKVVDAPGR